MVVVMKEHFAPKVPLLACSCAPQSYPSMPKRNNRTDMLGIVVVDRGLVESSYDESAVESYSWEVQDRTFSSWLVQ